MTEISQGWRDSEEVRAAKADHTAKLDYMMVCCEVQAEAEAADEDEMDAETLQRARDNALFATAEYTRTLEALLDAVWASAVRGRAEQEPVAWIRGLRNAVGAEWRELTFSKEAAQVGLTVQGGDKYHDCAVVNVTPLYLGGLSRGAGGEDTARLDWLQAHPHDVVAPMYVPEFGGLSPWVVTSDSLGEQGGITAPSIREAIDRARSPSGPPQEAPQ